MLLPDLVALFSGPGVGAPPTWSAASGSTDPGVCCSASLCPAPARLVLSRCMESHSSGQHAWVCPHAHLQSALLGLTAWHVPTPAAHLYWLVPSRLLVLSLSLCQGLPKFVSRCISPSCLSFMSPPPHGAAAAPVPNSPALCVSPFCPLSICATSALISTNCVPWHTL